MRVLDRLRDGLIVSCQAPPGDPLRDPSIMAAMAVTAERSGAVGVRVNGPDDVAAVRDRVGIPVIGLWKDGDSGVYITPTADHARRIAEAGADIVAVDATGRPRPDGRPLRETIDAVHAAGRLVMADVAAADHGVEAVRAGADLVGTTLSGYLDGTPPPDPDLPLVTALADRIDAPVLAEGRIHTPEQAAAALRRGAWAVVVGTAITAPGWITRRYVGALESIPATARRARTETPGAATMGPSDRAQPGQA